MAHNAKKTEHSGSKKGSGAYWGRKKDAKRESNRRRREDCRRVIVEKERIEMRFCTAINCLDGRVQLPIITYLQGRFDADYVDTITEAGPNLILAETKRTASIQSILERLRISFENHDSVGVAIVGHYGCAGNPAPKDEQIIHIQTAARFLQQQNPGIEVIGLWVDENWEVHEAASGVPGGRQGA